MGPSATALAGLRSAQWPAWWFVRLAFIGIELVAHLVLHLRALDRTSGVESRAAPPKTLAEQLGRDPGVTRV